MKHLLSALAFFALILVAISCESPTDGDNTVTLSGQVVDNDTGLPVAGAVVQVKISPSVTGITDAQGTFRIEFEITESTEVTVLAFKESFEGDSTTVLAVPGRSISLPSFSLQGTGEVSGPTGGPAAIVLKSQSAPNIGVRESGSPETAQLVFEIQDSTGRPIDLAQSAEVRFSLGSAPNGGEFIHPAIVNTDGNGHAETYIFSGTIAGAVQIIAEIEMPGITIRSIPVAIAIHGGLPDSAHFSISFEKVNFPGYNIFGLTNGVSAYVGDKYANPVRPGTSVSFTTSGGIIQGSAQTNELGIGTVSLLSAEPRPVHPVLGPGFATVTATTADENQNLITARGVVLFSGIPQLTITPTTFNIPNGGAQTFFYTISDQNNNPLAGGTSISIGVDGTGVSASGDINLSIPDTQSPAWTQFSFTIIDADTSDNLQSVNVFLQSSGPNGNLSVQVGGTAR